jgi:hypothetical protein
VTINWLAFLLVFVSAIVAAAVVVTLFATGIRLFATPPRGAAAVGAARDEEMDDVEDASRPASATALGILCFIVAGAAALGGVALIVH